MESFKQNNCRLCHKTFCCEKCRAHHEEDFHNVNPECELCIYGRTTIKEASVSLLSHIKSAHWPLHCVFCKKVFSSLDELVPHDKCPLKVEKMCGTPKTPVTPVADKEEPSPEITPFYKTTKNGTHQNGPTSIAMAASSTPLFHKEEINTKQKITPDNQSLNIHKSNLKLTGSSNLSDSKRSDRRVTFSETPSFSDCPKKPKCFSLPKQIEDKLEDEIEASADDSYASVEEEIFKTAPTSTKLEEKENINNELIAFDKSKIDRTLWESALTTVEFSGSNVADSFDRSNKINVSLQINVFNSDNGSSLNAKSPENAPLLNKPTNIWSSVTNIVKSVVSNISMTAQSSFTSASTKRPQPDELEAPTVKRMKLTELKCRRPIRAISPTYMIRLAKPQFVDKATQTDEIWI
ncbi:hypothetical protein Zmor_003156 [Zophobas morio]|uniref:C2H2-type domain-containing protein n=1 Tax=Zophobas morio TaxID=2755281 RepID=A0AA38HL11_9CUCU|nr:hypothetical protein Zmor_003156 [Zophobas morio]